MVTKYFCDKYQSFTCTGTKQNWNHIPLEYFFWHIFFKQYSNNLNQL